MRNLRTSFVTLVASAAVLAPAGLAATSQADLVNVDIHDNANGNILQNNISPAMAANLCGVDVDVITAALLRNQQVACSAWAATHNGQQAYIAKH